MPFSDWPSDSFVVRNRQIDGGRILGIDAGHRFQQDRGIAHVAGNRAGLVERRCKGNNAPARAAAIGRLDADGAGEGCRLADRAAGIGCGRTGAEVCGNGSGRSAGRTAGNELLVGARRAPGIDHGTVVRGFVGRAHGELVHVELAEHDGAVVPEVLGDGRLVMRLEAVEDMAAGLRVDAFGGEQVLDAERNAFERACLAAGKTRVGRFGHLQRLLRRDLHIGIELLVGRFDRRDIGLGQFGRFDVLGTQLRRGLRQWSGW